MWKEGGCGWVDGCGGNTHVHESCAHTDCGLHNPLYLPSLSPRSPLALPSLSPHSPQGDGALDQRESAGNKVLINWRAYTDMHRGTQSFITQMVKMVGTEPLEASGGNTTLLPTYRVCEVTSCTPNVPYLSPLSFGPSCLPSIRCQPSFLTPSSVFLFIFPHPSFTY